MYAAVKHIHLLAIALSVTLFVFRYILLMANSKMLEKKWLKITPHITDTVLLVSGITLIFITGFIPFTTSAVWLTEKITCVGVYIALGFVTFHYTNNKVFKTFAFLGALGWLFMAAKLAMMKVPMFLG
ncbi:SirB2 family protein [Vibrio sp. SS-MA-C1-2]|uniref:SirB2 family protein n=1 Tax=Vibrio sp. SS-MA-C1-2 TaxID=2908646 RepID=UPI001F492ABF|nr:SirB2 family protein [Vibrio sp. SS-MA-C1-2]UJF18801.1 SirB2 family protein [Vibrio sp. SS-MA-C1-2]